MTKLSFRLLARVYLVSVLLIHALLFWNARTKVSKGYPDFTIYYTAGTMVRAGMAHQLYDYDTQFRVQKAFAPGVVTRLGPLPFNHPPLEAVFFAPLTFIPYPAAYVVWLLINLTMLAALPYLLRPHIPLLRKLPLWAWFLLELAYFPVFMALVQGQDSILLLLLYALAFVSLTQDRPGSAGACLACGLFKFHLVLPFLALLLAQQRSLAHARRILAGFLLLGTVLGLLSIALVGPAQIAVYPHFVMGLEATMAHGAILPTDMANVRGAFYLIASTLPHIDAVALSVSAAIFLFAIWILRRPANRTPENYADGRKLSLALLVTILVSYHALAYDLCILAIAALLLAQWLPGKPRTWKRLLIAAGLAGLLFSPLQMVLLVGHNRLGWLVWALLACATGVAGEILTSHPHPGASSAHAS